MLENKEIFMRNVAEGHKAVALKAASGYGPRAKA